MAPFRIRTVLEEFEAQLRSDVNPAARGKSERKRYGTGQERLTFRANGLDLPDGTPVDLVLRGTVIARCDTRAGRARVTFLSEHGSVPVVAAGDPVALRVGDRTLLRGVFEPE
jgi:hypothetical protein